MEVSCFVRRRAYRTRPGVSRVSTKVDAMIKSRTRQRRSGRPSPVNASSTVYHRVPSHMEHEFLIVARAIHLALEFC
jgi:hypothetical protein